MMKIIQVSPRYYPHIGGIESYVQEISKRLCGQGDEVEVYTTDPVGDLTPDEMVQGVRVRRFRCIAPWETTYFSGGLYKALVQADADIIHIHGYRSLPMFLGALAKGRNFIPLIVSMHLGFSKIGRWVYSFYNPTLGNYIFKKSDMIHLVSPAEAEEVPTLKCFRDKTQWIPNGVEISRIDEFINENRDVQRKENSFLYVGRLERKKGVHRVIDGLKGLKDQGQEISMTVVGDGPYMKDLERQVKVLGLEDEVEFTGRLAPVEIYPLYLSHTFLVLFSDFEAHSMGITEALAFGMVPIVTDVGGNRYLFENGKHGHLVSLDRASSDFVEVISSLDHERVKNMEGKNRDHARRTFDIEETVRRIRAVYLDLR